MYEVIFFWDVKMYIVWKCIQCTIHWDKTQILRKFPSVQKMPSFFFCKLQLLTVLLLICDCYMRWSTKFISLKLCVGFSISNSFAPRPLIFKLQQEVLKFTDICVSRSSPKTDLVTNVLNTENHFENVSIVIFK